MHYFVSDTHLGSGDATDAQRRELQLVHWLEASAPTADAFWLMGDLFDFWFEYRRVVPAGYTRLLGKLSELTDRGIPIHFFPGNHDLWVRDYLERECGLHIHRGPQTVTLCGRRIYLAHGDNLGMGSQPALRLMNGVFRSRSLRWLFSWVVHPDAALRFGAWWSGRSRKAHDAQRLPFHGFDEPLARYAASVALREGTETFLFGHIHKPAHLKREGLEILFLGSWLDAPSYATLDVDGRLELHLDPAATGRLTPGSASSEPGL